MNAHVLQHVPFEGLGSIESWLLARAATITYTRFYAADKLPAVDGLDMVITMGGPMSVNDEAILPWLKPEKQFLRDAIAAGVPVLGVCLGAQLIASALGARVYPNRHKEIGWFDIEAVPTTADVFQFPLKTVVFHWHGETFDLPPGAMRLARSAGCENQAFQIGAHVLGLQFHLETTRESLDAITTDCRRELVPGAYIQTESVMRAAPDSVYANIQQMMDKVLAYLAQRGTR